jgi:AcrR family transcriptional regulator
MSSESRKRSDGRDTMAKVIQFATAELELHGSVKFNLDRVIEQSGISRSSIYHHFGNRDGVLAAIEIERFTDFMMNGVVAVRELLAGMSDIEEWLTAIDEMLISGNSTDARAQRVQRVSTLVVAQENEKLMSVLSKVQMEGTKHLAETLQMAVSRGLMHPTAPTLGIAYIFQSILVGRILVDLDEDPEANTAWVAAGISSLRHLINGAR